MNDGFYREYTEFINYNLEFLEPKALNQLLYANCKFSQTKFEDY